MSGTAVRNRAPLLGILVTHGRLGEELLRTAEEILGAQPSIAVASNAGHSHESLAARVEALAAPALGAGEPVVVMVDLLPGSCGVACRSLVARHPGILLAGGVNLPMLLEFLYQRTRVGRRELRARLEQKGREAIACVGWDDAT